MAAAHASGLALGCWWAGMLAVCSRLLSTTPLWDAGRGSPPCRLQDVAAMQSHAMQQRCSAARMTACAADACCGSPGPCTSCRVRRAGHCSQQGGCASSLGTAPDRHHVACCCCVQVMVLRRCCTCRRFSWSSCFWQTHLRGSETSSQTLYFRSSWLTQPPIKALVRGSALSHLALCCFLPPGHPGV